MSSSASLSSAKKKRASVEDLKNNLKQNNLKQNELNNLQKNYNYSLNDIVKFHEHRLNEFDDKHIQLNEQQLTLNDNMTIFLETSEKKFTEIDKFIISQKKSHFEKVNSKESPEDIQFYKEKISSLEKQISELKTLVLKVQNYAMDSQLNDINIDNSNKINETKLEEYTDNNINNAISFQE